MLARSLGADVALLDSGSDLEALEKKTRRVAAEGLKPYWVVLLLQSMPADLTLAS